MHKTFRKDRSSGSRAMQTDRYTNPQTDGQTDRNTPFPYRAEVIIRTRQLVPCIGATTSTSSLGLGLYIVLTPFTLPSSKEPSQRPIRVRFVVQ